MLGSFACQSRPPTRAHVLEGYIPIPHGGESMQFDRSNIDAMYNSH
jgi:hypothetical protein